ncbi:MAG: DNA mismatch repair protein MutS [Thermoplasmata archaeon]
METPLMAQYYSIKKRFPDTILLFRVGDFYETFYEDAKLVSKELNIVLTSRNKEKSNIPLAGVPYHAIYSYLSKLIEKGYKVAICEQLEDPKKAKGLVKRDVIRVITPGTILDEQLLTKENNYLASLTVEKSGYGIVFVDISTNEMFGAEYEREQKNELISDILKYRPAEILAFDTEKEVEHEIEGKIKVSLTYFKDFYFDKKVAEKEICEQFGVPELRSIGLENKEHLQFAISLILKYIADTQKTKIKFIKNITIYESKEYMLLDYTTLKNLEIFDSIRNEKQNTLFGILDQCKTSIGSRTLKRWIQKPLLNPEHIKYRSDGVEVLYKNSIIRSVIFDILSKIGDLERINSRISFKTANPRDLITLKNCLKQVPYLKEMIKELDVKIIKDIYKNMDPLPDLSYLIEQAIIDNPPNNIESGGILKDGYNESLDQYRKTKKEGINWISSIEEKERRNSNIKNLKIGYNDLIGYYFEISTSNSNKVPAHFIRKQSLKNSERFTTPELQEKEYLIRSADENIVTLEKDLYLDILNILNNYIDKIQNLAQGIGQLDALNNLAELAVKRNYTKPIVDDTGIIELKDSKHPILDIIQEDVVANDLYMDSNENRFLIITGPNMAGKSTYMRQIAIIIIMAQIGSFVPAKNAKIGVVDKIFTRVGASDDVLRGQSTFMTEMIELSNILNSATSNSLVILDEIGRGTSTFDGLSIAWATAEYIHNTIGCKTLFATHYHQMIELEKFLNGIKNYYISVKETPEGLVFIRKIMRGGMSESYGIEVAKLAGLPTLLINRARQVLEKIESENVLEVKKQAKIFQSVFEIRDDNELLEELKKIDISALTPIEALNKINEWKKKIQG